MFHNSFGDHWLPLYEQKVILCLDLRSNFKQKQNKSQNKNKKH